MRRGRGFCCGFGSLCFFGKGRGQPCEGEEDRERGLAFFFCLKRGGAAAFLGFKGGGCREDGLFRVPSFFSLHFPPPLCL